MPSGAGNPFETPDIHGTSYGQDNYGNRTGTNTWTDESRRLQGQGTAASQNQAPTTDYSGGNAYGGNGLSGQARNGQLDALTQIRQRAMGIHTANDATMNTANANAVAQQRSVLAGARGPAALAGAPQQATAIASHMNTANANNMHIVDARDTAQAQDQLAQAYGQVRQGDESLQGIYDNRANADSDLALRQRGLNDAGQQGFERMGLGANEAGLGYEEGLASSGDQNWAQNANAHEQSNAVNQGQVITYGGAAANAGSGVAGYLASTPATPAYNYSDPSNGDINRANPYTTSDQRAKTDVHSYAQQVTASAKLLEGIGGNKSWRYKPGYENPGETPGKKNFGPMVQDLEKSEMGREMKAPDGPGGVKRLDVAKVASGTLGALADMHQRVKALEFHAATTNSDERVKTDIKREDSANAAYAKSVANEQEKARKAQEAKAREEVDAGAGVGAASVGVASAPMQVPPAARAVARGAAATLDGGVRFPAMAANQAVNELRNATPEQRQTALDTVQSASPMGPLGVAHAVSGAAGQALGRAAPQQRNAALEAAGNTLNPALTAGTAARAAGQALGNALKPVPMQMVGRQGTSVLHLSAGGTPHEFGPSTDGAPHEDGPAARDPNYNDVPEGATYQSTTNPAPGTLVISHKLPPKAPPADPNYNAVPAGSAYQSTANPAPGTLVVSHKLAPGAYANRVQELVRERDRDLAKAQAGMLAMNSDERVKRDIRAAEDDEKKLQDMRSSMEAQFAAPSAVSAPKETTRLDRPEEEAFHAWTKKHEIKDVDHPDSHYDYRGAFKAGVVPGGDSHWPDTFKQHGHPTFSEESRYSRGKGDGGTWNGDRFVPASKPDGLLEKANDMGRSMDARFAAPSAVTAKDPASYAREVNRQRGAPSGALGKAADMGSSMDAQFAAPSAVMRRVQDDSQFAAPRSLPPAAYAAHVNQLRAGQRGPMLSFGVSEEPNQSQNWGPLAPPEPTSEMPATQSRGGPDGMSGARDAASFARKTLDLTKKGNVEGAKLVAKHAGTAADVAEGIANPVAGAFKTGKAVLNAATGSSINPDPKTAPPNATVPLSEIAGNDTTLQGDVPAPKASDAAAEPETVPQKPDFSRFGPEYTNVAAKLHDLVGPEAWKKMSERDAEGLVHAYAIHGKEKEQAKQDVDTANTMLTDAGKQADEGMRRQGDADIEGHLAETRQHNYEEDAKNLANYHEDPDHFWNSRTTAQKVSGFIGIALGGFAQGMRGGSNAALDQINGAINRDIEAQRATFRANKDSVDAKKSAYGMAMEKYQHDDAKATAVLKMAGMAKASAVAEKAAAQHRGTQVDVELEKVLQAFKDRSTKEFVDLHKYEEAHRVATGLGAGTDLNKEYGKYYLGVTERGEQPIPFGTWARGRMGGQTTGTEWSPSGAKRTEAGEKQAEADQKRTIIVDGQPRLAVNDGVVKDWNDYSHVADEVRRNLAVLKNTRAGGSEDNFKNQAAYDKAKATLTEIMPAYLGFARGPSVAQVKHTLGSDFIPDYVHLYSPNTRGRANATIDDLEKTIDTVDKSTREHTLGQSGRPTIAPQGGGWTPKSGRESK